MSHIKRSLAHQGYFLIVLRDVKFIQLEYSIGLMNYNDAYNSLEFHKWYD